MPNKENPVDSNLKKRYVGVMARRLDIQSKLNKGLQLLDEGDSKLAVVLLEPVHMELENVDGAEEERVLALAYLAHAHQDLGNMEKSLAFAQRSLELIGASGISPIVKGEANFAYGAALVTKGDPQRALPFLERGLALFEASHNRKGIANTCRSLGNVHLFRNQFAKSLAYSNRSIKIFEQTGEKRMTARVLNNIALAKGMQGMYSDALKDFKKVLDLGKKTADHRLLAVVNVNMGHFNNRLEKWDDALEHYKTALAIAQGIGDRRLISFIAFGTAEALAGKGWLEEAHSLIQDNFKDTLSSKSDDAIGWTLKVRGMINRERGELSKAQDDFSLAEKVLKKGNLEIVMARVYVDWGRTLLKMDNRQGALDMFDRSRTIYRRYGLPLLEKELDHIIKRSMT